LLVGEVQEPGERPHRDHLAAREHLLDTNLEGVRDGVRVVIDRGA
jgi:hypothetical protein